MGDWLIADAWLLTLSMRGEQYRRVAKEILQAQIVAYNVLSHELRVETEYLRRAITHSARYGGVSSAMVACRRCGTQATLRNWVDGMLMGPEQREKLLADRRMNMPAHVLAYLRECPGAAYAADIAASAALPRKEE